MSKAIETLYDGTSLHFNDDGWINATEAAARFGKRPYDWLALASTKEYVEALCRANSVRQSSYIKTTKGGGGTKSESGITGITSNGGTWLHPKLAVLFARWLSVDFAIWCDTQISEIIQDESNWSRERIGAAQAFTFMCSVVKEAYEAKSDEKPPFFIYANEAKLVNYALTGKSDPIDRDSLSKDQLNLFIKVHHRNTALLMNGVSHAERKELLRDLVLRESTKILAA